MDDVEMWIMAIILAVVMVIIASAVLVGMAIDRQRVKDCLEVGFTPQECK